MTNIVKVEKTGSAPMMKAMRLHEFGGPRVMRYEDAPMPEKKVE